MRFESVLQIDEEKEEREKDNENEECGRKEEGEEREEEEREGEERRGKRTSNGLGEGKEGSVLVEPLRDLEQLPVERALLVPEISQHRIALFVSLCLSRLRV